MSSLSEIMSPKCFACPVMQETIEHIAGHEREKQRIEEDAQSDLPEEYGAQVQAALAHLGIKQTDQDLSRDLRKQMANALNSMDSHIDALEIGGREIAFACKGLLRMRAERDGTTYTVGICASGNAPRGEIIEPLLVKRT